MGRRDCRSSGRRIQAESNGGRWFGQVGTVCLASYRRAGHRGVPPSVGVIGVVAAGGALAVATGMWGAYNPNSRLFGPVIGRGPDERVAFLTFDDGPNPGVTERILEVLDRERVPATFFMVGKYVKHFAETAKTVARAGHEIGNHTYSHVKLHRVGFRRAAREITRAHQVIADVTGYDARSFRAPHGYRGPFVSRAIAPYRYLTFGWT